MVEPLHDLGCGIGNDATMLLMLPGVMLLESVSRYRQHFVITLVSVA